MSEPIYKVFLVRPKARMLELSQEEQASLMAKEPTHKLIQESLIYHIL